MTSVASLKKEMEERLLEVTQDFTQKLDTKVDSLRGELTTKMDAQYRDVMQVLQALQAKLDTPPGTSSASKKDQEPPKIHSTVGNDGSNASKKHDAIPSVIEITDETPPEVTKAWTKKVELPTFEGEDPLGWLTRAEKFFELQGITADKEKLRLALICMDGDAIHWFQYWKECTQNISWNILSEAIMERFGDCALGSVHERLSAIQQRNSVNEYIRDFEILLAQAKGTPENIVLGYFLNGLCKPIRDMVRLLAPKRVVQALSLARHVEEQQRDCRDTNSNQSRFRDARYRSNGVVARTGSPDDPSGSRHSAMDSTTNSKQNTNAMPSSSIASTTSPSTGAKSQNSTGARLLTKTEHARRWRERLCFSCGSPFTPGHKCAESNLRIIILGDNEDITGDGEIVVLEEDHCAEEHDTQT